MWLSRTAGSRQCILIAAKWSATMYSTIIWCTARMQGCCTHREGPQHNADAQAPHKIEGGCNTLQHPPHLQCLAPRACCLLQFLLLELRQPLRPRLLEGSVSGTVSLRCCRLARQLLLVAAVLRCKCLLTPAGTGAGTGQCSNHHPGWLKRQMLSYNAGLLLW
jgi:hypothetical protein